MESKTILEIASDLTRLRNLGKSGSLTTQDLSGGTITLSNIGTVGGTYLHPVLVQGQVCIGAIGQIKRVPRFDSEDSDVLVARRVMAVSWNADHRVVDGASVARFVEDWKRMVETPALMLQYLK